jgi:hypothetical protein
MQKVNHAKTQAKPTSLNNALGFLYPRRNARAMTVFECDAHCLEEEKLNRFPFREILVKRVLSNGVDEPRDKK